MHPAARAAAAAFNGVGNVSEMLEQADPAAPWNQNIITVTHPFSYPKIRAFLLITDSVAMAFAHKLLDLNVLKLQVSNFNGNWLEFTQGRTGTSSPLMLNIHINNNNNNNVKANI